MIFKMYNLVFKVELKFKNKIFLGSGSGPGPDPRSRSNTGPGPGSAKSARTGPGLDLGQSKWTRKKPYIQKTGNPFHMFLVVAGG